MTNSGKVIKRNDENHGGSKVSETKKKDDSVAKKSGFGGGAPPRSSITLSGLLNAIVGVFKISIETASYLAL